LSQDTTHRYWRECDLCLSTHHLAIPAASSRDHLSSLCMRGPKATHDQDTLPLCLGSNCSLDKERPGLAVPEGQGLYDTREACQRPARFFFTCPGPRWRERKPGSEATHTL